MWPQPGGGPRAHSRGIQDRGLHQSRAQSNLTRAPSRSTGNGGPPLEIFYPPGHPLHAGLGPVPVARALPAVDPLRSSSRPPAVAAPPAPAPGAAAGTRYDRQDAGTGSRPPAAASRTHRPVHPTTRQGELRRTLADAAATGGVQGLAAEVQRHLAQLDSWLLAHAAKLLVGAVKQQGKHGGGLRSGGSTDGRSSSSSSSSSSGSTADAGAPAQALASQLAEAALLRSGSASAADLASLLRSLAQAGLHPTPAVLQGLGSYLVHVALRLRLGSDSEQQQQQQQQQQQVKHQGGGPVPAAVSALSSHHQQQADAEAAVLRKPSPAAAAAARTVSDTAWALAKLGFADAAAWREVASLAGEHAPAMSSLDCVQSAWALARVGALDPHAAAPLAARATGAAHTLDPQGVALLLWAYATAGHYEPRLVAALAARGAHIAERFSPQSVSMALWATAKLRHHDARLLSALRVRALGSMRALAPQAVANVAWALATLGVRDDTLMAALSAVALERLPAFTVQGLSNLAWAAVRLGWHADPRGGELVRAAAAAAVPKLRSAQPQEMANLLWACGTAGVQEPALLAAASERLAVAAAGYGAQDLSQALWGLAALRHADRRALGALARAACGRLPAFDARAIGNTAWALATLVRVGNQRAVTQQGSGAGKDTADAVPKSAGRSSPQAGLVALLGPVGPQLAAALSRQTLALLPSFRPDSLATTLWALGSLGTADRALMHAAAPLLVRTAAAGRASTLELMQATTAAARARYNGAALLRALGGAAAARMRAGEFAPGEVLSLLHAFNDIGGIRYAPLLSAASAHMATAAAAGDASLAWGLRCAEAVAELGGSAGGALDALLAAFWLEEEEEGEEECSSGIKAAPEGWVSRQQQQQPGGRPVALWPSEALATAVWLAAVAESAPLPGAGVSVDAGRRARFLAAALEELSSRGVAQLRQRSRARLHPALLALTVAPEAEAAAAAAAAAGGLVGEGPDGHSLQAAWRSQQRHAVTRDDLESRKAAVCDTARIAQGLGWAPAGPEPVFSPEHGSQQRQQQPSSGPATPTLHGFLLLRSQQQQQGSSEAGALVAVDFLEPSALLFDLNDGEAAGEGLCSPACSAVAACGSAQRPLPAMADVNARCDCGTPILGPSRRLLHAWLGGLGVRVAAVPLSAWQAQQDDASRGALLAAALRTACTSSR